MNICFDSLWYIYLRVTGSCGNCLTWATVRLVSSSNVGGFQCLHILSSICYCFYFIFSIIVILVGWGDTHSGLICISLVNDIEYLLMWFFSHFPSWRQPFVPVFSNLSAKYETYYWSVWVWNFDAEITKTLDNHNLSQIPQPEKQSVSEVLLPQKHDGSIENYTPAWLNQGLIRPFAFEG